MQLLSLCRAVLGIILFISSLPAYSTPNTCAGSFQIKSNAGIVTVPLVHKISDKFVVDLELTDENVARDIAWLMTGFDRYISSDYDQNYEDFREASPIVVRLANRDLDYGDLEDHEIAKIQQIVDQFDHRILVVGSTMGSRRRNRGADVVLGKREEEKSDIDYMVLPPANFSTTDLNDGWEGAELELINQMGALLPDADPDLPIITSVPNLYAPALIFRPKQSPLIIFRKSKPI